MCGYGSVPLSHSENFVTRTGLHTHTIAEQAERLSYWIGCSPFTQEVEGSTPTDCTCPNDFLRFSRPGYPHQVCSELENSGIRVVVGDCSVTERRRWRPLDQTGKTMHVHTKTLLKRRGRTHGAGCARPWFRTAEPLGERRYENWITHTR